MPEATGLTAIEPTSPGKTRSGKPPRRPRIEEHSPAAKGIVLNNYVSTGSIDRTAAISGLARCTVKAMLERNPDDLATVRKALANQALVVSESFLTQAALTVTHAKGTSAAVGAKVLGEMALQQLDKMPSQIQINVALLSGGSLGVTEDETKLAVLRSQLGQPAQSQAQGEANTELTSVTPSQDTIDVTPVTPDK